jgi:tetratricopeptide (TPR) repeat protein
MRWTLRITVILAALFSAPNFARSQVSAPPPDPAAAAADSLEKSGKHAEAMHAYAAITARHPDDARYWYALGVAASGAKEDARAAEAFETAGNLNKNPFAFYNAAAMHARMGHSDQAFAMIDRSIKAGLIRPDFLESDSDFTSIRSDPRFAAAIVAAKDAITPCKRDPETRKFDFWVGEWKLTAANGRPAGESSIQLVSGQCAVLENFHNVNGAEGKSLSAYNALTKKWQQFWVGQQGGVTEYRDSKWDGSTLVFFSGTVKANGQPQLIRMSYTPLSPDKVRQFGETSDDDGKTWQRAYDIIYDRKK